MFNFEYGRSSENGLSPCRLCYITRYRMYFDKHLCFQQFQTQPQDSLYFCLTLTLALASALKVVALTFVLAVRIESLLTCPRVALRLTELNQRLYLASHWAYPHFISGRRLWSSQTRAAVVKRTRTQFGKRAFSACGPNIWNSLPPAVRSIDSHRAFSHIYSSLLFWHNCFFYHFITIVHYWLL